MKYQPKTDAELAEEALLPIGEYDFEVKSAEDKISKSSGNEMIALTLRVFLNDGAIGPLVNDYLVPGSAFGDRKIKRAIEACGLEYQAGEVAASDFLGKAGRAKIGISRSKDPQYADKNGVVDYLPNLSGAAAVVREKTVHAMAGDIDDEIPF